MTTIVDIPCGNCKHIRPKIDGWKSACDAFPKGIPYENLFYKDIPDLKECNNGIGYEPKKDK